MCIEPEHEKCVDYYQIEHDSIFWTVHSLFPIHHDYFDNIAEKEEVVQKVVIYTYLVRIGHLSIWKLFESDWKCTESSDVCQNRQPNVHLERLEHQMRATWLPNRILDNSNDIFDLGVHIAYWIVVHSLQKEGTIEW